MSQYMPYKNFRWIEPKDFDISYLLNHSPDSDIGYILEVDLEYTPYGKELTKRFPLCPEKKKVNINYFSTNQRKIIETDHKTIGELLITNLTDKYNYVVHYHNLQFYLNHGITLKRINRILSFNQKSGIKEYIQHNTDLRTKGTTNFEKDIWKLMNNSFFGKTMENVRRRENVELETNPDRARKQFA